MDVAGTRIGASNVTMHTMALPIQVNVINDASTPRDA